MSEPTIPSTLLVTVEAGIARLTLNAPERLNAVDAATVDALAERVLALDADPLVRVIAITGAGRGFCSGADLGQAQDPDQPVIPETLFAAGRAVRAITGAGTPVVALVNGVAAGLGASLALACSYVLASEAASFVLAFSRIGLMPDGGATALVAASIGRARALRMALTAEKVSAATAFELGLIAESCPVEAFAGRSAELLAMFVQASPDAVARTVAAVNAATLDLEPTLAREEEGQLVLLAGADFAEGVAAFTQRRAPIFPGG